MNFLNPAAFALGLLIPILIAMYLLKLRRTEQEVSSVFLWRRMVRDIEANAPWQKLQRNLLLLLQLLFLIVLILALARPFTWKLGAGGQAAIFIMDTSASMAAGDVPPSRMEEAKAQARQLVNGLSEETRITVIAAGQGAQVLAASSQDRRQVLLAIDSLQPGTSGSDLTAALQLASAIAARQPDTEIMVLSDGRVTLPERLAIRGRLSYYPIGLNGDNQAISLFTLEATAGGNLTAFVQVTNYNDQPSQRRLELYSSGPILINVYDLEIQPKSQHVVLAEDLPPETRLVEARLTGTDALPLDDHAWAVYRPTNPAAVTLVTEGNIFLQTALGLLPGVNVTNVRPKEWDTSTGGVTPLLPVTQTTSLTILDGYVPITSTLPAGNLFYIAPLRSTTYFSVTGSVDTPVLRAVSTDDPLLSNVNLAGVNVLDSAQIALPDWARPVIVGDTNQGSNGVVTTPLLFAGEVDGRRVAVLAFDIHRSDLPLQVAFPLLLSNLLDWLAPGGNDAIPTQVAPGVAVVIQVPLDVDLVSVTPPDGSRIQLSPQAGRVTLADTSQLGVYQLIWGEAETVEFAVNLFNPQESDLRPLLSLPVAGVESLDVNSRPQQARREWWRPLAFAALGVMMAEWLVYQRATLSRLWAKLRRKI